MSTVMTPTEIYDVTGVDIDEHPDAKVWAIRHGERLSPRQFGAAVDRIKRMGGRWSADSKAWILVDTDGDDPTAYHLWSWLPPSTTYEEVEIYG